MWSGNLVDQSNSIIFGCPAYAHAITDKLEPKAIKHILMEYVSWAEGYRLWFIDKDSPRFMISMDVIFHEDAILNAMKQIEKIDKGSIQGQT